MSRSSPGRYHDEQISRNVLRTRVALLVVPVIGRSIVLREHLIRRFIPPRTNTGFTGQQARIYTDAQEKYLMPTMCPTTNNRCACFRGRRNNNKNLRTSPKVCLLPECALNKTAHAQEVNKSHKTETVYPWATRLANAFSNSKWLSLWSPSPSHAVKASVNINKKHVAHGKATLLLHYYS